MEITGVTYSVSDYKYYEETRDKNIFEEIVDKMILDEVAGMNESFKRAISSLPKRDKRMAILSILDKDRNLFKRIKALSDQNINKMEHIKDIILMLREYVKVGEVEKKKFGEVMTPLELVKEMLATLPEEVWSNPNLKWLDPANGTGPYPIMVIYKLMNGLKNCPGLENDEDRYKHIVENMIYVCELQPKNQFLYMCAVDPFDNYDLNVYTGSFLDEGFDKHMKEVWEVDKFNIAIGNPPYNSERGDTNNTISIYPDFIDKCYLMCDYIIMITPSRWFGGSSSKKHRENMINNYGLSYIKHFPEKDKFSNTDIKGGVSYFLTKKGYVGNVKFVVENRSEIRDFKKHGIIFIDDYDTIIDKIKDKCSINYSNKFRRNGSIQTNDKRLKPVYIENKTTKCIASRDRVFYIDNDSFSPQNTYLYSHKVVTPLAQGSGYNRVEKFIYLPPGEIANSSYVLFEFETESDAKSFINLISKNIIQFGIMIRKTTQSLTSDCFENLPMMDLSKKWSDDELYKYFNLSQSEIEIVENAIENA